MTVTSNHAFPKERPRPDEHERVSALGSTQLLRLSTAGSVDDGKSTLIGRLLYETKSIFEDQLEAIDRASRDQGLDRLNLALLTDGLRAEREQGITIDVAYRYFSTPRRSFVLADTPGHVEYTRNMVTGASTVDLTIVLVDASRGVVEQSRRHLFLAGLLDVRQVVVCVNKMDLVGYDRAVFEGIHDELAPFIDRLGLSDVRFIPISALEGDNVVDRSANMLWYDGAPLLDLLETVPIGRDRADAPARLPVQWVTWTGSYRGYAGQIAGGRLRTGDEIVVLPSGRRSRVATIDTFDGPLDEAVEGQSVTVTLADAVDVSRGDLIAAAAALPAVASELEADLCWFGSTPLRIGGRYALKHTTRSTRAIVQELRWRVDVNTLAEQPGEALAMNEIGRVRIKTAQPLAYDPYRLDRVTGGFILIDEGTNETVAAGMLR
ncbi:MAG TPA: GTP-binding protein [Chloroflexota bacterium]|jgi:bifunctional enzyme CysN/CysC